MDKCTWGNSQASINLITYILQKEEYKSYTRKVSRLLSKQFILLNAVNEIPNKTIREATLKMWHDKFKELVSMLPEIVRTHVICVETGLYRQLIKGSKWVK